MAYAQMKIIVQCTRCTQKCPRKNSYEKENDKYVYEEFEKRSPATQEKILTNILGTEALRAVSE